MSAASKSIFVPDIGDFTDVEIVEVLVAEGDQITEEQSLVVLESDKATMEIPAPFAGQIKQLKVKVGDRISAGDLLAEAIIPDKPSAADNGSRESSPPAEKAAPTTSNEKAAATNELICIPDIGDFTDVEIIEVMIEVGDEIKQEQSLIALESDKATMEIPAPAEGQILEVLVRVGDRVSAGDAIAQLATSGSSSKSQGISSQKIEQPEAAPDRKEQSSPVAATPSPAPTLQPDKMDIAHASPGIRKFARELGVDLQKVVPSGRKGRITKEDIQLHVKKIMEQPRGQAGGAIPSIPEVDFSKFGETSVQPLSRIKKLSGNHLHGVWLNIPHVTHHDEVDVTDLEAFRKSLKGEAEKKGIRVTMLSFIVQALIATLKQYPEFNASLSADKNHLILKSYFHIGVAVDTPNGLVVPVIKNADQMGVWEISASLSEISKNAREGKLKPTDMQGGCISISSLGGIGGIGFTPLINAPEVAILGVSRARIAPQHSPDGWLPRLMLPLDLSYDHRVIDGAQAARFVAALGKLLTDSRRLLL